jgi:hypothetical protein
MTDCFYADPDRQAMVKQKCGGRVDFQVAGHFANNPIPLCYEHKKWWNKNFAKDCLECKAKRI